MNTNKNDHALFSRLSPNRLFLKCAIPSMVSMAVASLYTIADGIFVGRFIGSDALAAVNLVMPFIMISFALSDMIAVGSSVQISIRLGEKKQEEANRIFSFSCMMIFMISLLAGFCGYFFAEPIIRLMGAEEKLIQLAVPYLRVYALFSPGIMIFFALDNYLRICGKINYSMLMNVFTSVGNIALDWLFIAHFGWGIASAALASCLCLFAGTIICIWPFLRKKLVLYFIKTKLSLKTVSNIIANGSSEFFSNITSSVSMAIMNIVLLRIGGTTAVAAFTVVMYVDSVVKSLLFGMTDALQPAISYNYGAMCTKRVYALEKRVLGAGFLLSVLTLFLMQHHGYILISLFLTKEDPALLALSMRAMQLFSISYLFSWFGMITSSFFTALNRPLYSLLVSFGQTLIFPVFFLLVLPIFWQLDGVWLSSTFASFSTCFLAGAFLLSVIKKMPHTKKNA